MGWGLANLNSRQTLSDAHGRKRREGNVNIICEGVTKMADEPKKELTRAERLYRLRHSAAHIMAQAVLEMFPDGKVAIGPPIQDGFYYDFDLPRPLTDEDLAEIEVRMKRIVDGNHPFRHSTMPRADARKYFEEHGQSYKAEIIDRIKDDEVSIYQHDSFVDLCAGPH